MNDIVILTPTFNRAKTLPKLYKSLKQQNNKYFDWWIIDDGSTDETNDYINNISKENIINIRYVFKENGGKARALNEAFLLCDYAKLFVIVDSDDYLLPTAVETISRYINQYKYNKEIGAFFFHYETKDGKILKSTGKIIENDKLLTRYQYNNKFKQNDGCVCYFNRVIKKYRYPEFDGENYIGPTIIQMEMANEYKIVFSPEVIGVAEYLEGGLSKSGRQLRLSNPNGMIYYAKLMMSHHSKITIQIKYAISIWPYAKILNKSFLDIIKIINRPFLLLISYLPGQLLYWKWKKDSE